MGNWVETGLRRLAAPRRLMALAALAAVVGLVSGYADVFNQADRTLALRQGPPPAVAAQDFQVRRDTGPAGEILIHGEVRPDEALVLPAPEGADASRYWIVPLYPLGDLGAALLTGNAETVGATVSAQVARRAPVGDDTAMPVGYVLWPLAPGAEPPRGADALGRAVGPGTMGEVVVLNGEIARDGPGAAGVGEALRARGLDLPETPLAVAPYPMGRAVALAEIPRGRLGGWSYRLAVVLAVLALAEALRRRLSVRRPGRGLPRGESGPVSPSHPSLAPLTSQADIARAEAESEEPAPGHIGTRLASVLRRLRNPR